MSTTEQPLGPGLDPEVGTPGVPVGGSLLDFVKGRREQVASEIKEPKYFVIPAWQGALAIRVEYPEGGAEPIIKAGFRMANLDPKKAVDAALDIVLATVVDIVAKRPEDAEWQPLNPTGAATRIGRGLAILLEQEIPDAIQKPARYMGRHLWSPGATHTGKYEGDLALVDQAGEISQWLRGIDEAAEDQTAGE